MIGASLSKRSGLPWIADFRDPMVQEGDPADPYDDAQHCDVSASVVEAAVTPSRPPIVLIAR